MKFSDMSLEEINKLSYLNFTSESSIEILLQFVRDDNQKKELKRAYDNLKKQIFTYNEIIEKLYEEHLKNLFDLNFISYDGSNYVISLLNFFDVMRIIVCPSVESYMKNQERSFMMDDEWITFGYEKCKQLLKDARNEIEETKNNLKNVKALYAEDYYDKSYEIYNNLKNKYRYIFDVAEKISTKNMNGSKSASVSEVIYNASKLITNLLFFIKDIKKNYMTFGLDISGLDIDKEKYAFYIFSQNLICLKNSTNNDLVNPIYPVLTYFSETKDTDTSGLFFYGYDEETGNFINKYTYEDFLKDLQEYIKKHKEINCDYLPFDFFEGWTIEEKNDFLDLFTEDTLSNFYIADPDTIFLPYGTSTKKDSEKGNTEHEPKSPTPKEFSPLSLEKRSYYSKYKDKIYVSLLGRNMFKGYIANVLYNGNIIFEKYDAVERNISSKAGAAYIMNIHNFNIFSSMSITEIRNYIKTHDCSNLFSKVDFECHRGNWQERLDKYFNEETGITFDEVKSFVTKADRKDDKKYPTAKINELK